MKDRFVKAVILETPRSHTVAVLKGVAGCGVSVRWWERKTSDMVTSSFLVVTVKRIVQPNTLVGLLALE